MVNQFEWVDFAKCIGIIAVIVGDVGCFEYPPLVVYIYAFHMPLFFFICGYLFNYDKASSDFRRFILQKASRILIPYLFSCIVLYLYWCLIWGIRAKQNLIHPLVGILYGSGAADTLVYNGALWFLPAYFCATVILYFVVKIAKNRLIWGAGISILIAILGDLLVKFTHLPWQIPFGLDKAMIATLFCYSGYLARSYLHKLQLQKWIYLAFSAILFGVMVIFSNVNGNANIQYVNNLLLYGLGATAGIFATLSFSLFLASFTTRLSLLRWIGQASLVIMIFHNIGMGFLPVSIVDFFRLNLFLWKPEFWAIRALLGLAIALLIDIFIRNISFLKMVYYNSQKGKKQTLKIQSTE